jgi:hypothetical protein
LPRIHEKKNVESSRARSPLRFLTFRSILLKKYLIVFELLSRRLQANNAN